MTAARTKDRVVSPCGTIVQHDDIAFGRPRVGRIRVGTRFIAGPFVAGDSIAAVAKWFDCTEAEVEAAIRYELRRHMNRGNDHYAMPGSPAAKREKP